MPTTARAGCSRFPCNWQVVRSQISSVRSDAELSAVWLDVVNTIELEIAGRHAIVGNQVLRRLTPSVLETEEVAFRGTPEDKRESGHGCAYAWRVASIWARRVRRMATYLETLVHRISAAVVSALVTRP